MSEQSRNTPTRIDVIADLAKIRTLDWKKSGPFSGLRALHDLLPDDDRPERDHPDEVRDAIRRMLQRMIQLIEVEERANPPELNRSIAIAASYLLRLRSDARSIPVPKLYEAVADTWEVKDRHEDVYPMQPGTFKTNHVPRVYGQLADRLLTPAPDIEIEGPESATSTKSRPQIGMRAIVVAAVGIVGVAVALFFILGFADEDRSETAGLSETPTSKNESANFGIGLQAINRDYKPKWGSRISADATEKITFAVWLANRSLVRSKNLTLWTEVQQQPGSYFGHRVRVVITDAMDGAVLATSPWTVLDGSSNQFGQFVISPDKLQRSARFYSSTMKLVRSIKSGSSSAQMPKDAIASQYPSWIQIGRLTGGEQVNILFDAMVNLPALMGFGQIPVKVKVVGRSPDDWVNTASVDLGDEIRVNALLDNQSNFTAPARVRFAVRPTKNHRVLVLRAYGSINEKQNQFIGEATLNSASDDQIALKITKGSTTARKLKDPASCQPNTTNNESVDRSLGDGIALGGIDIGLFGGFTPHGNCAGTEFNQRLYFNAKVVPYSTNESTD